MPSHCRRSARFLLACRQARPALECLESRVTPDTDAWINPAGGAWDVPNNWDLGRPPQPQDDVVIRTLNFGAVIDHNGGADTVQSVSSQSMGGTLAVSDGSSLTVTDSIDVPNLAAVRGGVVAANNTGSLRINLRAEDGGEIHLPALTDYHGDIFTRIEATGAGSLIDLPALTTLMATTGASAQGEVRLDLIADQGGFINLPALASVLGHPPDYFVGFTTLRASRGGTFALNTESPITFAAAGELIVETAADVQAGDLVVGEGGDLTVDGSLEAVSVAVQGSGSATVTGAVTVTGDFAIDRGTTFLQVGAVAVGGLFNNQGGSLFGSGTIQGNVVNAGLMDVFGALTVDGNYTQTAAGQLTLRLRGAGDFDQLTVTGFANLDGGLNLSLAGGYQPQSGDQLQVVRFGAGTGAFARIGGTVPLLGVLYIYQPGSGQPPGVTLLF